MTAGNYPSLQNPLYMEELIDQIRGAKDRANARVILSGVARAAEMDPIAPLETDAQLGDVIGRFNLLLDAMIQKGYIAPAIQIP